MTELVSRAREVQVHAAAWAKRSVQLELKPLTTDVIPHVESSQGEIFLAHPAEGFKSPCVQAAPAQHPGIPSRSLTPGLLAAKPRRGNQHHPLKCQRSASVRSGEVLEQSMSLKDGVPIRYSLATGVLSAAEAAASMAGSWLQSMASSTSEEKGPVPGLLVSSSGCGEATVASTTSEALLKLSSPPYSCGEDVKVWLLHS